MRLQNSRIWTLFIAAAFLVLWCVSAGTTLASTPQEPASEAVEAVAQMGDSPNVQIVGILGWCLVGLGFLGVALTVALGGKPKKKRKMVHVSCTPRHPAKVMRSVYTPPPSRRYQRNVERRR